MSRAEVTASQSLLIHLAAEGLASIIPGCAATLATRPKGDSSLSLLEHLPGRAINYFGPPIIERWLTDLGSKPRDQQAGAMTHLAALSAAESRQVAIAAVERVAGSASAEDKNIAIEYLAAIPLAVRRSLVSDPASGCLIVPNYFWSQPDQRLLRLLPTDVPPLPLGSDLPGTSYRLEELLGIGGFGAVYKATNRFEQNQPPRAIKFCLDPSMVATLHRERVILDRLMAVDGATWSNRIVRLYGYALDVQPPFLVYEFVAGGDLTSHLGAAQQQTGRGFEPARALEIIRQVAEALAFAHGEGLVHRDLKPANVLVSGSTIKLTDFGIGGVLATHALRGSTLGSTGLGHLTAADQLRLFCGSGTPLYMSPEQRRGDHPDPRHDLYSLGVMWYQLLIGDVTRELHPGWPDELVEEFQVPQVHIELIQRCVGYFKKRPASAVELLPLFAPLLPRSAASAPSNGTALKPGQPTKPDSHVHEGDARVFERLQQALVQQIDRDAWNEARTTAAAMLDLRPGDTGTLEVLAFVDERRAGGMNEIRSFKSHEGWVRSVSCASDGRHALSGSDDATVRLWDLERGGVLRCLEGHEGAVMSVAFAPNGRLAVSGGWDGTIRCWDVMAGRELRCLEGDWQAVKCLAVSPNGRQILAGCNDHRVYLLDMETGRELLAFAGHTDLVQSVAFAPEGRQAVSGSDDGTVRVWEVATGRELSCLAGHQDTVTSVACAPDGCWVLSASSDKTVRLWDMASGDELRCLVGHTSWVNSVLFCADGCRALTASGGEIKDSEFIDGDDRTVRLWDLTTGAELCRFAGHTASVTSIALGSGGRVVLSGSLDKTVRLLSVPD